MPALKPEFSDWTCITGEDDIRVDSVAIVLKDSLIQ